MIGSAAEYTYADGEIVRGAEILGRLNLGPGRPEHTFAQTGRLPVFAGGNADVDIDMLESARFALLINTTTPIGNSPIPRPPKPPWRRPNNSAGPW